MVNTPLHHSDFLSIMAKLTYAERLDLERDRDGKPPLTPEERMAKLVRIRDGSLVSVESSVASGVYKGVLVAKELYGFAAEEIDRIEDDASACASTKTPWIYTTYPMDSTGPEAVDSVN